MVFERRDGDPDWGYKPPPIGSAVDPYAAHSTGPQASAPAPYEAAYQAPATPPPVAQVQPQVVYVAPSATASMHVDLSGRARGTNHVLHFWLSLFTCGAWLPVWAVVAIINAARRRQ